MADGIAIRLECFRQMLMPCGRCYYHWVIIPSLWKRYVDDTFVIQEQHKKEFFQHINSIDPNIKFTVETTKADGSMPFLDTLVTPQSDGSLATTV